MSLLLENTTVLDYIKSIRIQNEHTAEVYKCRLVSFEKYVRRKYNLAPDQLITTMTQMGHGPKIDVYELLRDYISYLQQTNVTTAPLTIRNYLSTVRNYLESYDVSILPRKYKLKVRPPRIVKDEEKEALSKEYVRIILNATTSIRQKTYLLFLSSTGCRARESLSIREMDIKWENNPVTIFIRGKYTKTQVSKTIMITNEMAAHIRSMLKHKYRTRHVHYYDKNNGGQSVNEIRTPKLNREHLIFSSNSYSNPTL